MPSALSRRIVRNTSCTITGARPIDGSSSSMIFGRAMSARPIASICCSPPDSVPAEQVVGPVEGLPGLAVKAEQARQPAERAEQEVVLGGERPEPLAALGRV